MLQSWAHRDAASTLLNILGFLDNPHPVTIFSTGLGCGSKERDSSKTEREQRFCFSIFNLLDELNVFENVELPLKYIKKCKTSERKQKVEQAFERMKKTHRAKHFPQQLSGGQQQRVAIASACVANPRLIRQMKHRKPRLKECIEVITFSRN
jgi:putative ABC transport system ATP-binding protein